MPSRNRRLLSVALAGLAACGAPLPGDCPSSDGGDAGPGTRTYGGTRPDTATAVAGDASGALVVAGSTRSFAAVDEDVWVLKLGRGGEVLWEERFEGPASESAVSVAALGDGGAAVLSNGSVREGSGRRSAILLARLDCAGGVVWARSVAPDDGIAFAHAVRESPDGGFLVAGEMASYPADGTECLVVKLAADGSPQWHRAYGREAGDVSCHSIAPRSGGGFLVAGEYERLDSPRRWSDVWLVGLDGRGEVEWERTYGDAGVWERRPAVRESGDGTFLVSAMRDDDAELLAVDASGRTVWQRAYRTPGTFLAPSALWVSPDGAATIVGTTRPADDLEDVWALRVSAAGDPVWSRRYARETIERGAAVAGFTDGRVVLAGTLAWGSPQEADDAWVLWAGSDGRAGALGDALAVTDMRMNVAPRDTAVRVRVPEVAFATATVRASRTQSVVRTVP